MLPHLPGVPHLHVNRPLDKKKNSYNISKQTPKPLFWQSEESVINCSPFVKGFDQVETVHYFSAQVQWKGIIHCQARKTAANTPNTKSNR